MNKSLYRIVFNKVRGMLMAVAETAVTTGKAPGTSRVPGATPEAATTVVAAFRPLQYSILLALGLASLATRAQIVADPRAPGNQQPTVLNAGNGVPLINIQTPSAAGVSRNTYSQFDVNAQGAILNNARKSAQTQLGGWVQGNPWLAAGTARVILNEVNSSNPSLLRGYLEVAGDRAQVVIANPAGITCDGCGFINANRATLTTGTPIFNNGNLDSYRVQNGMIGITGAGLDASRTDYTDIIARSVQVNAGIWANSLKVTAGPNKVSADHTQTAAITASGSAPAYGLDVANLGGMYAGKITLVGTESGVGVRNAGQIGASAGDVLVTADGQLENSGRITASGMVRVDTKRGVSNSGIVYALGDTQVTTRGNVVNTHTIAAQGNTSVEAAGTASAIDSQSNSLLGAGIGSDGTIGGSGTLQLAATGQIGAHGQNLASADATASGAEISLAGSQTAAKDVTLTASGGGIELSGASISATQTLTASAAGTLSTNSATVSADRLSLAARDIFNTQGNLVQTGTTDLAIRLPGQFDNTNGRIAANGGNLSIGSQTLINTDGRIEHAGIGTLSLDAITVNGARGAIGTNGTLSMTSQTITLDGGNVAANKLGFDTHLLSNRSGHIVQAGSGNASIAVRSSLNNSDGTIAANGALTVSGRDLLNQGGTIQAAGASPLTMNLSGALDNSAKGKIAAGGDASIRAATLSNASGGLTAGGALDVLTAGAVVNAGGLLAANENVTIVGSSIDNASGQIGSARGGSKVTASAGVIDNTSGRIEAARPVAIAANGLTNTDGVVSGRTDVRLNSSGRPLDNTRGTVAAGGLLEVQSGRLTNDAGSLQASGTVTVDTHGQTLSNTHSGPAGGIIAQSAITLRTGKLDNSAGFIGATGDINATTAQITNARGGQITGKEAITLTGTGVDNRGGNVQALGNLTIDVGSGTVDNSASLMRSGAALTIGAGSLINRGTHGNDRGVEAQSISVTADAIDNRSGAVRADTSLSLTGSGTIDNTGGLISSAQSVHVRDRDLTQKTQRVINKGGTLIAAKSLGVNSAGLSGDGSVLSQGDLNVSLAGDFLNAGNFEANSNAEFETAGKLTNQAVMRAGKTLTVNARDIENVERGEFSAATSQISAAGTITNRGLIDGQDTTVTSGVLNNVGTGRIYGDHSAISAGTVNNDAENDRAATIAARSRLDIGAQTITNREHSLIFSAGDMAIGGAIDGSRTATGSAGVVNNNSASIEALGELKLTAVDVNNTNEHFATTVQRQSEPAHIVEYQGDGSPNRYASGDSDVRVYNDESDHLHTPERNYESWSKYEYDRTTAATVIAESDPGRITSGGAMRIDARKVLNDKSQIIAGGALDGNGAKLQNTEVAGQQIVTDVGTVTSYWRNHRKGRDDTGSRSTAYTPPATISEIRLTPTVYRGHTAPGGSGTQIAGVSTAPLVRGAAGAGAADVTVRAGRAINPITEVEAVNAPASGHSFVIRSAAVNTTVPNTSLFSVNRNPTGHYLIETDRRFVNYREWLSSDYMLEQLRIDPALTHKRLGDGFYEQKLIREQIAQLTGRRFLRGYASDEAEYRALINNGLTYAKEWDLRPGIALTAAQMARLTSDIVWLVESEVTLPDGQTAKALVPQVYVLVKQGDIDGTGALISGQTVDLKLSKDLVNQGTIAGRDVLSLTAENVKNLGGRISGSHVAVKAKTDLLNLGGTIDAANSLSAIAGRDLKSVSTTNSNANGQGTITNISRVAGLYVTDPSGGTLVAAAGRDLTLAGSHIGNASTDGQTVIAAGRDLNLTTIDTSSSHSLKWDANNWRKDSTHRELGASIQTVGDLRLSAGRDLNARGASVTSEQGALIATAENDINLTSSKTTHNVDEAHQHKGKSSWFSSKTISTRNTLSETMHQGTTFSGDTVHLQAGHDINLKGSNVVSTHGTSLFALHDVNIEAAINSATERHHRDERKTGLFGTGGIGFTIGTQQHSQDNRNSRATASASVVGSTNGNVAIVAGNHYRQVGSHVLAPQGDIDIQAKKVDILAAEEISHSAQETRFKQSGLTVAVTAPVVAAIQTAGQMKHAAGETSDMRLKLLAGATTGLAGKNAADAAKADPKSGGGVSASITVGGSKSQSKTTEDTVRVAGSKVLAGGGVRIRATGAGEDSKMTVQGSDIEGGGDVHLKADGAIALLAAKNAVEMHRSSSSMSGGVGVAVSGNSNGASFGVTANASASRGKGDGTDVMWTNTHVSAGKKFKLESGGDTTLRGAVVGGRQVLADVGGNLTIESLQDTSTYQSKDESVSGSVTVGYGVSGSANYGQQKMDSDFASVTEQSGIKAGDGGFQINVKGDTHLNGGVITSTERAIADGLNSLTTATLTTSDIQNRAEYSASGFALGGGYSSDGGGMSPRGGKGNSTAGGVGTNQQGQATTGGDKVPGTDLPRSGNWSAAPPVVMGASGDGSSTTVSGISGGAIHITDEAKQQALTGKSAEETVASVNRAVTTERDGANTLKPIFDERELQAGFEIVGAWQRETGAFLANRAKEVDAAQAAANDPRLTPEERVLAQQKADELTATWGPGGSYRRVLTALTAAAGGNVTGGAEAFMREAAVSYLQGLAVSEAKELANRLGEGTPEAEAARAALHAIVGCAGAAASAQTCNAGAMGAAASSVLGSLLGPTTGLSAQEKEAQTNLVTSFVAGVAGVMGDPMTAANAAGTEGLYNRQLLDEERHWTKEHANRFAAAYEKKTGQVITLERAEKSLLGTGYMMVDDKAKAGPGYDMAAAQYISENSGNLFKATAAERADPGSLGGPLKPEQRALPGAVANPALGLGIAGAVTGGLAAAAATPRVLAIVSAGGRYAADFVAAYKAAQAGYSLTTGALTGAGVSAGSYTFAAAAAAALAKYQGADAASAFDERFSLLGFGTAATIGAANGIFGTSMFKWADIPNKITNVSTVPGAVIRINGFTQGQAAGRAAQAAVNQYEDTK
ncbi:hemagglutinin repeat-containing protein [Trinickia sp. EG282A]|uniref:two-partner secretion domain-containing protein n=1 Tax=Trinickia sp. EG282A TaxID=3237013 RepID=UPI0034D1C0F8